MNGIDRLLESCYQTSGPGFAPFSVGEAIVGWVRPDFAQELRAWPDIFEHDPANAVRLHPRLTTRESQVLERIVAGRLNKQIADDLGCMQSRRPSPRRRSSTSSAPPRVRSGSRRMRSTSTASSRCPRAGRCGSAAAA